jgi:transposase
VIFRILKEKSALRCPQCGSARVICKGSVERRFAGVPIGSKPVLIVMAVQRVLCLVCHVLRQITIDFADPRRSYTRQFERYALELSRHMTIKDVAAHLNVNWDVIKD